MVAIFKTDMSDSNVINSSIDSVMLSIINSISLATIIDTVIVKHSYSQPLYISYR